MRSGGLWRHLPWLLAFTGGVSSAAGGPPLIVATEEGLWRLDGEILEARERIDGGDFSAIAFGQEGNLFAVSGTRVLEYDGADYSYRGVFVDAPALTQSAAIAMGADGRLYVAANDRVLGFERANPSPVSSASFSGVAAASGLAADREGRLFLSDALSGRVFRIDPASGEAEIFFERLGAPGALAFAESGGWVAADNSGRPAIVRVSGQDRWLHGFFEEDLPGGARPESFRGAAIAGEAVFTVEAGSGSLLRFPLERDAPARLAPPGEWGEVSDLAVAPLPAADLRTYAAWREEHFGLEERGDPRISGPEADPVGDGLKNLLRFAFGGGREPLPRERLPRQELVEMDGTTFLQIRFVRARRLAGEGLRTELAEVPGNWQSAPERFHVVSVENLGDLEAVVIRDRTPLDEDSRRFYRLRIELPEEEG